MAFPRPHQRYDSIVDGDVIVPDFTRSWNENMGLFKFPCGRPQYEPAGDVERVQIPLNGDSPPTFSLHLAQTQDAPKNGTAVDEQPRGNIRRLTTVHWLRFEGSSLLEDMYSQDDDFTRRTNASETEEWCDPQVNVPTYVRPFGQPENTNSTAIDWSEISDLNATLALRYTYTNASYGYHTVRMTTEVSVLPQRPGLVMNRTDRAPSAAMCGLPRTKSTCLNARPPRLVRGRRTPAAPGTSAGARRWASSSDP